MTTMQAMTPEPNTFWYEMSGERAGMKNPVKNLGWIIKHRKQVIEIDVSKFGSCGAHFQATLDDGRRYYCRFESLNIALKFANLRRFYNVQQLHIPL